MKIIIITQDSPFYLYEALGYFFKSLPKNHSIIACITPPPSPFGKRNNFVNKAIKTKKVFGLRFFLFYSLKFFKNKLTGKTVKRVLKQNNIPNPKFTGSLNSPENLKKIKKLQPDLLISILGNEIFKKQLIQLAPKGCINVHSSLLPKYRGLLPTFWVLKNNELFTGVSVFYVDEGIDSGPIILQQKIAINNMTHLELIKTTKKLGINLILKSIDLIEKNNVNLIDNPDKNKSYYSFPTRSDVLEFKKAKKSFY